MKCGNLQYRAVDFPRSRNRGGNDGKSTVTRILVVFFFFFFFFFLVGDQNELVVIDFRANIISQTNFLFVEEIMNDTFRA